MDSVKIISVKDLTKELSNAKGEIDDLRRQIKVLLQTIKSSNVEVTKDETRKCGYQHLINKCCLDTRVIGIASSSVLKNSIVDGSLCTEVEGKVMLFKNAFKNLDNVLNDIKEYSYIWILYHSHRPNETVNKQLIQPLPNLSSKSIHGSVPVSFSLVKVVKLSDLTIHFEGGDIMENVSVLDIKPYIAFKIESIDFNIEENDTADDNEVVNNDFNDFNSDNTQELISESSFIKLENNFDEIHLVDNSNVNFQMIKNDEIINKHNKGTVKKKKKYFQCHTCGKLVTTKFSLRHHIDTHNTNDGPKYCCDKCGSSFNQIYKLNRHKLRHTDQAIHCTICNQKFASKITLAGHMKRHEDRKKFSCPICDKIFIRSNSLKLHMRLHTGERPFKCDICGKSFSENLYLKSHMKTHTDGKKYSCMHCEKSFSCKINLVIHLSSHTGEKQLYQCTLCEKSYAQSSLLTVHMRTHTGEKPFLCSICGKCFSRKKTLNVHIRTHTGEKPHKCQYCERGFLDKSALVRHTRTHTGERPHKCTLCEKAFIRSEDLVVHSRTHTGEKPHQCSYCGIRFNDRKVFQRHTWLHTGYTPYKCDRCPKGYIQKKDLKRHLRNHLKDDLLAEVQ